MAYRLTVILDDGLNIAGATSVADEIRDEFGDDVTSVTVYEIEPGRASDD